MNFQRVSKKAKRMWRLTRILVILVVLLPVCAGAGIMGAVFLKSFIPGIIAAAVFLLIFILAVIIYPAIEYIQWAYLICDDRIEIKKGIIFRTHSIVPVARIQHVNVSEGPFARIFGLAAVEIHTAGGEFRIEGVENQVANEIGDKLRNLVNKKIVAKRSLTEAANEPV